jgi:RecB family endonuclease NucS
MREKDIENLLAQHPEEFFPNAGFRLLGQQVNIGRRFVDIMFVDKYDRTIIIEVKRGLLTRDGAGQIIEYYGLLKQQYPDRIIELILCANVIPSERKLFLENVGIECKELGLALLLNLVEPFSRFHVQITSKAFGYFKQTRIDMTFSMH